MRLLDRLRRPREVVAPPVSPGERQADEVARRPPQTRRDWEGLPPPALVTTAPMTASDPFRGAGRALRWQSPPRRLAHARSGGDGGLVAGLATVLPVGPVGARDTAGPGADAPEPDLTLAQLPRPVDLPDLPDQPDQPLLAPPSSLPPALRRLAAVAVAVPPPVESATPPTADTGPAMARRAAEPDRTGASSGAPAAAPAAPAPARVPDVPVGFGPGVRLVRRPLREPGAAPASPAASPADEPAALPLAVPAPGRPAAPAASLVTPEVVERVRVVERTVLEPRRLAAVDLPPVTGPSPTPGAEETDVPLGPRPAPASAEVPPVRHEPAGALPLAAVAPPASRGVPVEPDVPTGDRLRTGPAAEQAAVRPGPPAAADASAGAVGPAAAVPVPDVLPLAVRPPRELAPALPPAPAPEPARPTTTTAELPRMPLPRAALPDAPLVGSAPLRPLPGPVVLIAVAGPPLPGEARLAPGRPVAAAGPVGHRAGGGVPAVPALPGVREPRLPTVAAEHPPGSAPRPAGNRPTAEPWRGRAARALPDLAPTGGSPAPLRVVDAGLAPQPPLGGGQPWPDPVRLDPVRPPLPADGGDLPLPVRPATTTGPGPGPLPVRALQPTDGAAHPPVTSGRASPPLVLAVTPEPPTPAALPDAADPARAVRPGRDGPGPALLAHGLARAAAEVDAVLTADPFRQAPAAAAPGDPDAAAVPAPVAPAAAPALPDVAALADEVYEHVRERLRDELLAGRERTASLADL